MSPGLNGKYQVSKAGDGAQVDDAFVLRVSRDPAAWLAAWYYAGSTYNMDLAQDLRQWLLNHAPEEESLGDEGRNNLSLLAQVLDTANSPHVLPHE